MTFHLLGECGRFGSTIVAVLVCGRFCMWLIWLWPFWFVAVLGVHHP